MISDKSNVRVNQDIKSSKVRLIDFDGTQLGIFLIKDALRIASERQLDLVEIAPNADPPVCKIIDYGKFKYEQQKKEKLQRKNQTVSVLKEIRLHPNTDVHDFEFKAKHAANFIEEGNKVKVTVIFKGRELAYIEQGEELINRFIGTLTDIAKVEVSPKLEGKNMSAILIPIPKKGKKQKQG